MVLDADPLADIRNTRRIDSVVVAGRHIGADERARLLDGVARAAAGSGPPAAPAARRHCC